VSSKAQAFSFNKNTCKPQSTIPLKQRLHPLEALLQTQVKIKKT